MQNTSAKVLTIAQESISVEIDSLLRMQKNLDESFCRAIQLIQIIRVIQVIRAHAPCFVPLQKSRSAQIYTLQSSREWQWGLLA